jgi:hypothetical protein
LRAGRLASLWRLGAAVGVAFVASACTTLVGITDVTFVEAGAEGAADAMSAEDVVTDAGVDAHADGGTMGDADASAKVSDGGTDAG